MFASFQKKYFLSDKGVAGVKRGVFWTTLTNLITMAGMGFLFLVMAGFVEHLASGADLPDALPIVGGLLVFFVLLFASNWQQLLLHLLHLLRGVRQAAHGDRRALAQTAAVVFRPS